MQDSSQINSAFLSHNLITAFRTHSNQIIPQAYRDTFFPTALFFIRLFCLLLEMFVCSSWQFGSFVPLYKLESRQDFHTCYTNTLPLNYSLKHLRGSLEDKSEACGFDQVDVTVQSESSPRYTKPVSAKMLYPSSKVATHTQ